jgi:hypothetical protein
MIPSQSPSLDFPAANEIVIGWGFETFIVVLPVAVIHVVASEHTTVYLVFVVGCTLTLHFVLVDHIQFAEVPLSTVLDMHDVTLDPDQEILVFDPEAIVVGFAEIITLGTDVIWVFEDVMRRSLLASGSQVVRAAFLASKV